MSSVKRRLLRASLAAVFLTVMVPGVGLTASAVAAPAVTCGAILKADATLTADLSCPAGNGVTLYRGVTLDLGGHTLSGPGTGTAVTFSAKGGSTVTNGSIRNWALGVDEYSDDFYPAPTARVTKVAFDKAPLNFSLSIVSISQSTFSSSPIDAFQGILVINGSRLTRSGVNGFYTDVRVGGSTVTGGAIDTAGGFGAAITKTTMDGTGFAGSPAACSETTVSITDSTVKNYRSAIGGYWCFVSLTRSSFTDNKGGVVSGVDEPGSLTVTDSTFTNNGIALDAGEISLSGSTFTANVTGVIVRDPAASSITGSTFTRNSSSGVRALGDGLELSGNTAINNGRYGIHAPHAINQGGNIAYGNTLDQCVGLSCATQ